MYSKEMILEEIRRVADNLGVNALKQKDFEENSTIPLSTVKYYLGTWKGAIKDAGLSVSGSLDVVKREDLLKDLMRLYNESGETPTPAILKDKGKYEIKLYENKWKSLSQAFAEARKMKNLKTDSFATQEIPEVTLLAEDPIAEAAEPAEESEPLILDQEKEIVEPAAEIPAQELDEAYIIQEDPPVIEEPEEEPSVVEEPEGELPPPVEEGVKSGDDHEVNHESIKIPKKDIKKPENAEPEGEVQEAESEEEKVAEPEVEKEKVGEPAAEEEKIEKPEAKEQQVKKRDVKRKDAKPAKDSTPADKEQEVEDIELDDIPFDDEEDVEFHEHEAEADQDEDENILEKMDDDEHKTEEIDKKDTAARKKAGEQKVKSDQGEHESMIQKPKIRFIPQTVKPKKMVKKKTVLGEPISFRGLRYAPVNKEGVIFFFGMVSQELGFIVETLRPDLPDCEGTRYVDESAREWERVRMCFCFKSSDFKDQDENICDLIICWHHDWEDSPLEILELSDVIKYLSD